MSSLICQDLEKGVRWVSIHRPDALNALNVEVLEELRSLLEHSAQDESVRVLVLSGEGEKSFIAGADIVAMAKMTSSDAVGFGRLGHDVARLLEEFPVPTIAAVHGFALGGGAEMALACDFILASDRAVFGLPEVGLGVIPGFGGTSRLLKRVGIGQAKEMIFSGKKITAQESFQMGLVNQVFSQSEFKERVLSVAHSIATQSKSAIQIAKKLINEFSEAHGVNYKADAEIQSFSGIFGSKDQVEGMKAFLEKRKPRFEGIHL